MKKTSILFFFNILVIVYMIVLPTYSQYELNKSVDKGQMYKIENFVGITVDTSFEILTKLVSEYNDDLFLYSVRPASEKRDKMIHNNYYFNETDAFVITDTDALKVECKQADSVSFQQSNGYLISTINEQLLTDIFSNAGLNISQVNNIYINDIGKAFTMNVLVIILLFIFATIINGVVALSSSKRFALLSLHGYSAIEIKLKFIKSILIQILLVAITTFIVYTIYLITQNKISITENYIYFYLIITISVITVYLLMYLVALTIVSKSNLIAVLKNKTSSNIIVTFVVLIQIIMLITLPLTFQKWSSEYNEIKVLNKGIQQIYSLNDYYTYNGTNANIYDSLDSEGFTEMEKHFRSLYDENIDNVYYLDPYFESYLNHESASYVNDPFKNIIFMNENYYTKSSSLAKTIGSINKNAQIVMIPLQFKTQTTDILEHFELKGFEVKYIEDDITFNYYNYSSTYEYDTTDFIKTATNSIIVIINPINIVDYSGNNAPLLQQTTVSQVFYKMDNIEHMINQTLKHNLNDFVTPSSKLQPYLDKLQSIEYTYYILIYTFLITFIASFILNMIACEVIMESQKKKIAVGFLYGKSILFSMKGIIFLYLLVFILSLILTFIIGNNIIATISFTFLLYAYVLIYLIIKYNMFLKYKILRLLKGD